MLLGQAKIKIQTSYHRVGGVRIRTLRTFNVNVLRQRIAEFHHLFPSYLLKQTICNNELFRTISRAE